MFTTPTTTRRNPISHRRAAALLLAGALALVACGSDGEAAAPTPADTATTEAAPAASSNGASDIVAIGATDAGDILVDESGLSLYGFLPDEVGTPTCGGACADAWPPLTVPTADVPAGLDADVFGVVEGLDGGFQLTAGGWPLYTFAGDAAAGETNGQGSGDAWFLVAPDGSLISG